MDKREDLVPFLLSNGNQGLKMFIANPQELASSCVVSFNFLKNYDFGKQTRQEEKTFKQVVQERIGHF